MLVWKFTYIAINLVVVYGLICPYLISADQTELVGIGFVIMIANALHLIFFGSTLVNQINNQSSEEGKNQKEDEESS